MTSGVDEGRRNDAIVSLSGLLFRFLPAHHAELAAELVACWNAQRCRPPLEAEELARTLDWHRGQGAAAAAAGGRP